MKKKIKIALVGCGRVANYYKKNFINKKIKFYKIVAVCDISKKKSKNFSKIFKCSSYTNHKDMINKVEIDLVLILTPSGLHYQQTIDCLKKKINVLCEKPLTLLPFQAVKINKIAKKNKVSCGVIFQNRLNVAVKTVEDAIKKNKFGKIVCLSISVLWCRYQSYYNDPWHGKWKMDGGVINQQAIHHIDIIRWLFGPVVEVSSVLTKRLNKLEAEDTALVLLKFSNGAVGTIEATTAARPKDLHASLSIVGEKGSAVIGGVALNKITKWEFIKNKNKKINLRKFSEEVENGYGNSHIPFLQKSINLLLKNKREVIVDVLDACETTKLIHSIYASHERKKWIKLKNNFNSRKLGK